MKYIAIQHSDVLKNGNPPALVLSSAYSTKESVGNAPWDVYAFTRTVASFNILDRTGNILSHGKGQARRDQESAIASAIHKLDNCNEISEKME